jgi:TPR repeat protein
MAEAPAAAPKPCCVCDAPNGKHCAKCKSRHYCGKACQLVDWKQGHKEQCKRLAAKFQDRLLDELMPEKKPKEAPPIVADVLLADGAKARLSAVQAAKTAEAGAPNDDAPSWRGTCAICLDALPLEGDQQTFYECCCKSICTACSGECWQYDERCPLCRTPVSESEAEGLRRLQKQVDKGNAEAQIMLGGMYRDGGMGLKQNFKRAVQLFELAAAQGHAEAQQKLGLCYARGQGVEIDRKTAVQWWRRAAEHGYAGGQCNLGFASFHGMGAPQSYEEAARWFGLAAAQGMADALFNLGVCHENGQGVPQDDHEALRFLKRAAAQGHAGASAQANKLALALAAKRAA